MSLTDKIILGIDPGTTIMGFGLIRVNNQSLKLIQLHELQLKKYNDHYVKLQKIFNSTIAIIDEFHPDHIAIEAPFFGKNVQSMLKLGRAQGVAMAAGLSREIPITEYSPKTKIFIHTILPINNAQYLEVKKVNYNFLQNDYNPSVNNQVKETNSILKSNGQYEVIDLHSIFIDNNFQLNNDLSSDGVHLNENGYSLWVQETMELIKSFQNN